MPSERRWCADMLALGSNNVNDKRVEQPPTKTTTAMSSSSSSPSATRPQVQAQGILDDCLAHDRRVVELRELSKAPRLTPRPCSPPGGGRRPAGCACSVTGAGIAIRRVVRVNVVTELRVPHHAATRVDLRLIIVRHTPRNHSTL